MTENTRASHGMNDSDFERGSVPMTKAEVRAVTLAKLQLKTNDVFVDLGAGTGSISIEAARVLHQGKVIAVERKAEAVELIRKNCRKFKIENLKILEYEAPEGLETITHADKIMIGGSGGHLKDLIQWAYEILPLDGRIAMNMITMENVHTGWEMLKICGFEDLEMVQLTVSRGKTLAGYTMMMGQNPVFVLSARKG
jgi:cobalt-precorrin-6B (C15)-methyltransferase